MTADVAAGQAVGDGHPIERYRACREDAATECRIGDSNSELGIKALRKVDCFAAGQAQRAQLKLGSRLYDKESTFAKRIERRALAFHQGRTSDGGKDGLGGLGWIRSRKPDACSRT